MFLTSKVAFKTLIVLSISNIASQFKWKCKHLKMCRENAPNPYFFFSQEKKFIYIMLSLPILTQLNGKANKCPFPVWTHNCSRIGWNCVPVFKAVALPDSIIDMLESRLHFCTRSCLVKEQAVKVATLLRKTKALKWEEGSQGQISILWNTREQNVQQGKEQSHMQMKFAHINAQHLPLSKTLSPGHQYVF